MTLASHHINFTLTAMYTVVEDDGKWYTARLREF